MKKLLIVLIALVSIVNVSNAQTKNAVVTNLSSERFKAIIENDKNGVILDLRTSEEITKKGYIKGAIQLDYLAKDSEKQIDKLDKNKTYYVYCASGGRSSDCAEYMEKNGFKRVYNLEKGLSDWLLKGFPVEKK
ncbi:MAG: rhodanese-like domain-containing protein [Bacteroidetes bacterium]|nr:rhodanese-like domain-containing protein [Bacteroidota bacterium]